MSEIIQIQRQGRVALVTHNRPEASNAFSYESYGAIRDAMRTLGGDPDVGAIVITGAGKHFSAGGDIVRFRQLIESGEFLAAENILYAGEMSAAIRRCPKPVIAMVNGVATGAGLSCALACDFRVAAPSSKLIMAFVNMGLCGDTGSLYFLPKLAGIPEAQRMMMTGEPVSGEEAYRIGLVSILAQEGGPAEAAMAFADKLANKSTAAIAEQKAISNRYFFQDLDAYFQDEAAAMAALSRKPDFKAAVYAFLEKKKPVFNQP